MLRGVGKVSSASVVLFVLASLSLAGCTSSAPEATPSPTRSASASPSPEADPAPADAAGATPSSAPTPAATPTQGEAPSGEGASTGTALTAQGVYDACRNDAWQSAASTPEELTWAPFDDAYVVQAGDAWRVYIEYVRTSGDAKTFDGAASCVFRGTAEAPVVERVGAGLRDDPTNEAYWTPLGE
jgi:hypothetical protein